MKFPNAMQEDFMALNSNSMSLAVLLVIILCTRTLSQSARNVY